MAAKPPYARDGFEKTIKTMEINKFIIENVRCFEGKKEFNIRPLTFLIGENSTGKSTLLGCINALRHGMRKSLDGILESREVREDVFEGFNKPPYEMGTFEDIARKMQIPTDSAQNFSLQSTSNPSHPHFTLGFSLQTKTLNCVHLVTFSQNPQGIYIAKREWQFDDGTITIIRVDSASPDVVIVDARDKNFTVEVSRILFAVVSFDIKYLRGWLKRENDLLSKDELEKKLESNPDLTMLLKFLDEKIHSLRGLEFSKVLSCYSIAPVRTEPKRTYDPIQIAETPQGDEIPVVLMRMSKNQGAEWSSLLKWLATFGKGSGMFSGFDVKTFSPSPNDPFQLRFNVRGANANLADIGYGVSQVLPILVRTLTEKDTTFLMQQPEVHLHPKAQAELLSLLTSDIAERKNRYVLETHSNYMIDRARIEIKREKISHNDVSLIYLEPKGDKVAVHNITFDEQANFIGAPASYNKFFEQETDELLGF